MSNQPTGRVEGPGRCSLVGIAGILGVVCACLMMGCMHMETQRTTLEHKPQVIAPEDSQGSRLVVVPEYRSGR